MLVFYLLASYALSWLVNALPSGSTGISFPLTRRGPTSGNLLRSRAFVAPLYNQDSYYYVNVTIGTPKQSISLVLDTGSSDVWVYAPLASLSCSTCTKTYFDPSKSSTFTIISILGAFKINYLGPNSGVSGYYAADLVGIGGFSVNQTIGVVTTASSGAPDGGIFGIGLGANEAITAVSGGKPFPTFIDSLVIQKVISSRTFSIFLNDYTAYDKAAGQILLGGYDSSRWTGNLVTFPLLVPAPNGQYALDVAEPSMSYSIGSNGPVIPVASVSSNYAVLLDIGTPVTRIPTAQFNAISNAVGGQPLGGLPGYSVPCSLSKQGGGLYLLFSGPNGSVTITVPWAELVLTDGTYKDGDRCVFGLLPLADTSANGLYILGETVLRSTYMYFNYDTASVSLAQIKYDH